jgi:penicillin-binding protein 1C
VILNWRKIRFWTTGVALTTLVSVLGFFVLSFLFPPNLDRFEARSQEVLAADGSVLKLFSVENGRVRQPVSLDQVDPLFIKMLVAYEDRRFYQHAGIDMLALGRAFWQALSNRRVISGASTLTMQTARLLEPRKRTLGAKLIEMFRALQLEQHFSKQEILELYLTLAPYGGNLEGVRAGSSAYFGHDSTALRPEEAALLVVLPQAPSRLRSDRHPARAKTARNKVLNRVAPLIALDDHLLALAIAAPVPSKWVQKPLTALHFSERVRHSAEGAYRIQSTINPYLQRELEAKALAKAQETHAQASVAILVVHNQTREVRAYVGSADTLDANRAGYVDMITAIRSPGSTLKPFIYGMAFERGLAHPNTRIRDEPRSFGTYAPSNFSGKHQGELSMREALQRSLNVPAVAVLNRLGPVKFTATMRSAGVEMHLPDGGKAGLAIALGGVGMSLEDLTALYAALADDGHVRHLRFSDKDKKQAKPTNSLANAETRMHLKAILEGVRPPGARLPKQYQKNPRGIAYKTGTSYGFRDAWAIGYDATYTVGIWVGRPDGTPLPGQYGSSTAAPLLFDTFELLPNTNERTTDSVSADNRTFAELPPALQYFDRPARLMQIGARKKALAVVFPKNGSILELNDDKHRLIFEANGGRRPLQWFVDGTPLKQNRWTRRVSFTPESVGFYQVTVVDKNGASARAKFRVVTRTN